LGQKYAFSGSFSPHLEQKSIPITKL
jgi:hypothetical protein